MFGAVEESAYNRNSFASNRDIISMYAAPYGGKISPSSSDYSNATARPPSSPSPPTLPAGASPAYHPHGQSFSSSLVRSQAQVVPQATRPRYPPSLSASPLPAISHSSQSSHSSSSYGISPLNYPTMNGQTHPPPTPYGRLPNSLPPGIAPSDAFYSSDPRRGDPRQTSRNAVRDPAAGDWRNTLEASRIYEGEPASQSSASSPASSISSRQPTIVTTPPIESSSRRPPSLSMSSSPSVATHSTFSQPPPSSPATSYHRRGNLSSNNSLTPNSALRRADSAGTTSDLGGANGLPEFLNPALLSNIAVFVKDRVPRGPRQKGAIEHPQSFTGDELVVSPCHLADPRTSAHLASLCRRPSSWRFLPMPGSIALTHYKSLGRSSSPYGTTRSTGIQERSRTPRARSTSSRRTKASIRLPMSKTWTRFLRESSQA